MLAAGLVARKARALGLSIKPWVKPSLGPGSRVVTEYYEKAGLLDDLAHMGFNVVGYGCTTCIETLVRSIKTSKTPSLKVTSSYLPFCLETETLKVVFLITSRQTSWLLHLLLWRMRSLDRLVSIWQMTSSQQIRMATMCTCVTSGIQTKKFSKSFKSPSIPRCSEANTQMLPTNHAGTLLKWKNQTSILGQTNPLTSSCLPSLKASSQRSTPSSPSTMPVYC